MVQDEETVQWFTIQPPAKIPKDTKPNPTSFGEIRLGLKAVNFGQPPGSEAASIEPIIKAPVVQPASKATSKTTSKPAKPGKAASPLLEIQLLEAKGLLAADDNGFLSSS